MTIGGAETYNDNLPFRAFDALPLFATDQELAMAIVGPRRAKRWLKERFPTISGKSGFPPVDSVHGGRSVELVRRFYASYIGITGAHHGWVPGGEENLDVWRKRRR
ncbi:MAG: hypothetical protein K5872_08735 [Rhizobiaceae bacterium]|nr:hypothetical protein [Rhizobiaceae bacterium]MCV0406300.1 hypothetical protein [Rhizobiaceae bacterium]